MSYEAAVQYLYGLQKFGIKFGLSKTSNLLESLGNPQQGQSYIHIGGTNGKGSVAAFLASILEKAGLKVGLYSSPHLVRFTERFRVNQTEMDPDTASTLISELKSVIVPEEPPTFFEATTAMALTHFAREKTDVAILEVGMGGRLDATNVIKPLVTVITNISMEHQAYLGNRLLHIAREKAGIIKAGVDVLTAARQPSVIRLFDAVCREKGTPLWRSGRDFRYRRQNGLLHYTGMTHHLKKLRLGLLGGFQFRNAALAIAASERLEARGYGISEEHIRSGLHDVRWAGRMHVVQRDPLIILDGSHNPAAIKALVDTIRRDFRYKRLILVLGIMADKAIGDMVRKIVPLADHVFYTRPLYSRAAEPDVLYNLAVPMKKPGTIVPLLSDALDQAVSLAGSEDLVLICGSLFTVGEALIHFDPVNFSPDFVMDEP